MIEGGAGKDLLYGGEGANTLKGGSDADTFIFFTNDFIPEFGGAVNASNDIVDFDPLEGDTLLVLVESDEEIANPESYFSIGADGVGNTTLEYHTEGNAISEPNSGVTMATFLNGTVLNSDIGALIGGGQLTIEKPIANDS